MNAMDPQRPDGDASPIAPTPKVYTTAEPSLGELITSLTDDFGTLVRKEIKLAKVETMETISATSRGAGMMAAGGLVAYAGLLLILIGIAVLVGQAIDSYWLAALIVGALVVGLGVVLFSSGRSALKHVSIAPEQTIASIKDDARMVKEQLS
jgi:hypothetical protein